MNPRRAISILAAVCLAALLGALPVAADVHYVAASGDNTTGLSWATAKHTVAAAVAAASNGDQVWVANGTYTEWITINKSIELYGGFTGNELSLSERPAFPRTNPEDANNNTILDGNINNVRATVVDVPSHTPGYTGRFDGFTVKNGYATQAWHGAGMACSNNSCFVVTNNTFKDNNGYHGGGLSLYFVGADTVVSNNTFEQNTSSSRGGGVYCYHCPSFPITRNVFKNNSSASGPGIYLEQNTTSVVTSNFILQNHSTGSGGGIVAFYSDCTIAYNRIEGNTATSNGAGITVTYCSPSIACNTIVGNCAGANGGGIYCANTGASPHITNNTIAGNTAGAAGGAVFSYVCTAPDVSNNIIAFNSSGIRMNGGSMALHNNNVYSNTSYNYSGISAGTGDISSDPRFLDAGNGDYHLTLDSPCIDAGDDDAVDEGWVDMDGGARKVDILSISGSLVDIGAYEYVDTSPPSAPTVTDDGATTTNTHQLHASWTCSDTEGGITEYRYAIGTTPGGTDVVSWTSTGTDTEATRAGLGLRIGHTYYISVKAENGAGLWSNVGPSDGIEAASHMVQVDLLGGLGGFEWCPESEDNALANNEDGFSFNNIETVMSNDDRQVAAGWWWSTNLQNGAKAVCNIVGGAFADQGNSQYIGCTNEQNTYAGAYIGTSYVLGTPSCPLQVGDKVTFSIDHAKMCNYAGVAVVYELWLGGVDGDGSNCKGTESAPGTKQWYKGIVPSGDDVGQQSICGTVVSSTVGVNIRMRIWGLTAAQGVAETGMWIDGASLKVERNGESLMEQVPVEHNNCRGTFKVFFDPAVDDVYSAARDYDAVELRSWKYPWGERLRYYNPDIKIYRYQHGGGVVDTRSDEHVEDPLYIDPFSLLYVLAEHTDWLYPYTEYDLLCEDERVEGWRQIPYRFECAYQTSYYTHIERPDLQELWRVQVAFNTVTHHYDGVLIDVPGTLWETTVPGGRPASSSQSFLKGVVPYLHGMSPRIDVMANFCAQHLDDEEYWAPQFVRPCFDPWFSPDASTYPNCTANYHGSSSDGDLPDGFCQEWAFLLLNGNDNSYLQGHWLKCLSDMDQIRQWNEGNPLPITHAKWMLMQVLVSLPENANEQEKEEAANRIRFGVTSYLLARNDWTTLGLNYNPYLTKAMQTSDIPPTGDFTSPMGDRIELDPAYPCYLLRLYCSRDDGVRGGMVVVNGSDSDTLMNLTIPWDCQDEGGKYVPYGSSVDLPAHSGRMFRHLTSYKYASCVTEVTTNGGNSTIQGQVVANRPSLSLPSTVQVKIDNGDWIDCSVMDGQWSYVWSGYTSGEHIIYTRAYVTGSDYEPDKHGHDVTLP